MELRKLLLLWRQKSVAYTSVNVLLQLLCQKIKFAYVFPVSATQNVGYNYMRMYLYFQGHSYP